jgi:putative transposase
VLLGFKTELKLNNQQRTALMKHCGVARHAWNWGLGLTKQILDHNKANPDSKIKFPTAIDLHKWLVAIDVVGVDLGVKSLAALSTGEVIQGAKSYKKYEAKLSRIQWLNRHKVKGSANWKKAQMQIARLHRKIANSRAYSLHKLTTLLAKNHGTVVIEDLNVSGMLANHQLAKAIADMGFYEFRRQLTYKCQLYGSKLVIVDRWFPSSKTCSNCGTKKETLSISQRVFECNCCNFVIDRDLNAAINLSHCVAGVPPVVASGVSKAVS